ncbi:hypothetical protein C364_05600 [Cryptococcus neoformans Bt63]|nr:hypothetical protein C364_05600 [Cryptococcus neoformans var. grubii Bt63]
MSASSQPRLSVREAALAAAQARLNPPPSYDSSSTYASNPAVTGGVVPQAATNGGSSVAEQAPFSPGSRASPGPALTDKEEKELKLKFGKLLNRGIVRDNGYKESAEAVETLLKIANNILSSDDPKYRIMKATNGMLQKKVLSVKGGHDYIIALGFRTKTVDFVKLYVFEKTLRSTHELKIGAEVLQGHLRSLKERVNLSSQSLLNHNQEEAARRAQALREIEADRESVKIRGERERQARETKEQAKRERRERGEAEEAEETVDRDDERRREMANAVVRNDRDYRRNTVEDEYNEDDDYPPTYGETFFGGGRRLGD